MKIIIFNYLNKYLLTNQNIPVTSRSFHSAKQLETHKQVHLPHDSRKKYECTKCPETFLLEQTFRSHLASHSGVRFTCEVPDCGKRFACKPKLRKHTLRHTDVRSHKCGICPGKAFKTLVELRAHQNNVHAAVKLYKCESCWRSFAVKSRLTRHVKTHDANRAKTKCPQCPKEFSCPESLRVHFNSKHRERDQNKNKCFVCGKMFAFKISIKSHIRNVHGAGEQAKCYFCSKTFKTNNIMKQHLMTHTGEKCYKCDQKYIQITEPEENAHIVENNSLTMPISEATLIYIYIIMDAVVK
ncbi:Zinc finger protein 14 [Folsomia candida]|uniref:Zinc finger protein 14 n=1 Tax=Folsomia candida TaxID=158441 RepID=A0A226D864_FOLCA|nr:Zinc finger protein 14 [Folsomia candida]